MRVVKTPRKNTRNVYLPHEIRRMNERPEQLMMGSPRLSRALSLGVVRAQRMHNIPDLTALDLTLSADQEKLNQIAIEVLLSIGWYLPDELQDSERIYQSLESLVNRLKEEKQKSFVELSL